MDCQSESTIHSEQLEHPQPKRTKLENFFDGTFRPRAGENGSATEVATTELQKYELEEPLGLENWLFFIVVCCVVLY